MKYVLKDQKDSVLSQDPGRKRTLSVELFKAINSKEIIVITGVRRCGKSTLLRQVMHGLIEEGIDARNILYVNFEDERLRAFTSDDFENMYAAYVQMYAPKGKIFIFADEIQNVKYWEKWAYRIREFELAKLFITGSNRSILKSDISSSLTGRSIIFDEYPFSLKELIGIADYYSKDEINRAHNIFDKYITYGGFPEAILNGNKDMLSSYLRDIISKDIVSRYRIKDVKEMEEFMFYLLNLYGKRFTFAKLKNIFNIGSHNTVKNFIEYAESSYLVFTIEDYSSSMSEIIRAPRKIYVIDHAMVQQVSSNPLVDKGAILENIIFLELKRRLKFDEKIFYWRDSKNMEVDFILKKSNKIISAIQVYYELTDRKDREIVSLLEALNKFNLEKGIIITNNYEGTENIGGKKIIYVPAWKFLIEL